jgi:hypothetical protein
VLASHRVSIMATVAELKRLYGSGCVRCPVRALKS